MGARASRYAVIAAVLLSATGAKAGSTDDIQTSQLVQEGSEIQWGHAVGVVGTPVDAVIPVITDYGNYVDFLPYFTKSQVLAKRGDKAMAYMEVTVAAGTITLWAQLKLVETAVDGGVRLVEAHLVDGNIRTFRASWKLTPVDDGKRTRVDFKMHVDPDLPLPSSMFSRHNEKAAGKIVEALREHVTEVESRSPSRPVALRR
jgi:ribosome-associated toxin RatA of RatAB toxin-antitoxin module